MKTRLDMMEALAREMLVQVANMRRDLVPTPDYPRYVIFDLPTGEIIITPTWEEARRHVDGVRGRRCKKCKSPEEQRSFENEMLARGNTGPEQEEPVFSGEDPPWD